MTSPLHYDVLVIGAGAAGLLAAAESAARGRRTLLLEKNKRPGVKILMSGGTRCNLTHATDKWGIIKAYGEQGNFLHSALAALSPAELVQMFEEEGVATKVEETGKVFPVSNKATDVLAALIRRFERSGAELSLDEPMMSCSRVDDKFLVTTRSRTLTCDSLLITVGGKSYPGSGTTGDGYAWAAALGHTIVPPRPALVPITTDAAWVKSLTGLTIPDVQVSICEISNFKSLASARGSFLFTHFGLSGPVILDVSRAVSAHPTPRELMLVCDFLPATKLAELEVQLQREAAIEGKKQIVGLLSKHIPRRLAEELLSLCGVNPELRSAELPKKERARLVAAIKQSTIPISGTRGFEKAEVTAGGVSRDEVDSRTMESKLIPGLFFAGEILDLDGPIGGYNFQAAFSTGVLAGRNA
ncbi:MAG: NAD(P)/FAD-dependent oxidoreductase [Planctomycetales bacterium]|nr:NAD(P)/FAD-dependent oxidoreductase [Planctomycetales bacterium]